MTTPNLRYRQIHRTLAPAMLLPLLLTLITGSAFEMAELIGQEEKFHWLIELHKGNFGVLNLEAIYPFLNALGLLVLVITGSMLWLQRRKPRKQ